MELEDKIKAENEQIVINQKNTLKQEKKEKSLAKQAERKEKTRAAVEKIKTAITTPINNLKIKIEDSKKAKEQETKFQAESIAAYNEYLNMANHAKGKVGVEYYDTEFGKGTIIFTEQFGPIIKTPINRGAFNYEDHYEGFAPNEKGIYEFQSVDVEVIETHDRGYDTEPGSKTFSGFTINSKTGKAEKSKPKMVSRFETREEYLTPSIETQFNKMLEKYSVKESQMGE